MGRPESYGTALTLIVLEMNRHRLAEIGRCISSMPPVNANHYHLVIGPAQCDRVEIDTLQLPEELVRHADSRRSGENHKDKDSQPKVFHLLLQPCKSTRLEVNVHFKKT
jgi:hypothetical protein